MCDIWQSFWSFERIWSSGYLFYSTQSLIETPALYLNNWKFQSLMQMFLFRLLFESAEHELIKLSYQYKRINRKNLLSQAFRKKWKYHETPLESISTRLCLRTTCRSDVCTNDSFNKLALKNKCVSSRC